MPKTVVEYVARRVTYETTLPFAEVVARLENELNKPTAGGGAIFRVLGTAKTREELERGVRALTGERDFVYFADIVHHRWLNTFAGAAHTPQAAVYTFGNPLIAQPMLGRDLSAGLHIPPKLLVLEKAGGGGTKVIYDDPACIIPVPATGETVDEELKRAAEDLSVKVERLVRTIVGEE